MTNINEDKILKDKIIKLCAFIEARVKLNDETKKYYNIRLVHHGFQDLWKLLGIDVPTDKTYGSLDTKYYYDYLESLKKDDNFFPKGFEKDLLLSK